MTLAHYLALAAALFLIGLFGALTRRNIIGILMGIELMFNAANINLAAFNRFLHPDGVVGSAMAVFNIAVAAAEMEALFFPQKEWILDAIHERILPLKGHVATTVQTEGEMARRARLGL